MKKLLILVATLTSLTAKAQTSVYHPFPDSNAVWRQYSDRFDGTAQICYDYQLYITGDTTINSLIYHNIYSAGTAGFNGNCNLISNISPVAGIREDFSKHIFVYSYHDSTEYLLYDFNLNLGDSLPNPQPYCSSPYGGICNWETDYITFIDSVQVGSAYRKRYWLSSNTSMFGYLNNYMFIIEGIGSSYGLFGNYSPNWQEKHDYLYCYKQNGQNVYPVGQLCALVPVGLNELTNTKNTLQIFPNPFRDKLNIEVVSEKFNEIILYDIASRKILQKKFINSVSLNTEQLAKGLYLYEVRDKNGLCKKGKVVKD